MENIGKRIKELRKKLGLSQKEFSEKIGRARNTIAQYEMGRRNVSNKTLKLIAQTFNVNEEWLKTGEGEMFTDKKVKDKEVLRYLEKAIERLEGRVPRYIKKTIEKGDTEEILEAIADYLYDLADEIKSGQINAETIKGNFAIGEDIKQNYKEEKD